MIKVSENKQGGFTLIEIIITLVIGAVVAAAFVQVFGTSLMQSSVPIQRLRQAYELQQVMENITTDYIANVKVKADLNDLRLRIKNTPGIYGTSYTVVLPTPKFIKFNSQLDQIDDPSEKNLLKVTIKKDSGEILTTLFSTQ